MTIGRNVAGTRTREANDRAASFPEVLKRELELIAVRRRVVLGEADTGDDPTRPAPGVFAAAQRTSALGLAFSGGGIRSATFNLGVLQGLAEQGLLKYVDYFSTVSGGGYMGSWLHGVMYRGGPRGEDGGPRVAITDGDRRAIAVAQLDRAAATLRSGIRQEPGPSDQDPITFLRKYSNYLAPSPGLFSADTWTIGFIWLRNVLLNQLILVPAIAALVAATLLLVLITQWRAPFYSDTLGTDVIAGTLALFCLVGAIGWMVRELATITRRSFPAAAGAGTAPANGTSPGRVGTVANVTLIVALVFATLVLLGAGPFVVRAYTRAAVIGIFVLLMAAIQYAGGYVECHVRGHGSKLLAFWDVCWMSIVTGGLAGALVTLVWDVINGSTWASYFHIAFGPPLIGVCLVVSVMLLIGLMGADYPDAAREWTARTGSTLAIVTTGWLVWFTLAVFGPWLVTKAFSASNVTAAAGVIVWVATTAGGVLAGRSPRTSDGESAAANRPLALLVGIAPTVFLIGYIVAIAAAVHALVPPAMVAAPAPRGTEASPGGPTISITAPQDNRVELVVEPRPEGGLQAWLAPIEAFGTRFPGTLVLAPERRGLALPSLRTDEWTQIDWLLLLFLTTTATAFIASRRINVNEFSLHHFYKNRLVRCYLGASNTRWRQPNPATGFDPLDDIPIARLRPDATRDPYFGPYPIINAALNLNAGSELATQERKATSFVFTPEYCGFSTKRVGDDGGTHGDEHFGADAFEDNGYRRTADYSYTGGPNVGTAMAISGAAANPNWGYHTSGPMAFLLTVFNARLGWWLGNPRWRLASREPGPRFALRYLFSELLGQTTARSQFVNLSDGGHFDNLGLYELVQRRCRFIIVCDAEEDRMLTFGSLGAAIRKCRADFGVEIDIDAEPIRQSSAAGLSTAHCVVGSIFYPEPETAFSAGVTDGVRAPDGSSSRGWLVYLKSSLTGDEPADVLEYRSQFPEFPHQSTGDQFFSESQFESYRRLGYHVCRSAFADVTIEEPAEAAAPQAPPSACGRLVALFQEMARRWYAPIPVSAEAATRLADAYVVLMQRIAREPDLAQLSYELTSGKPAAGERPAEATTAEIAAGMDLMQLVQNVYTEFNFESAFNRANPRNSGWMAVFRKWSKSPILSKQIWPRIKDDYHSLFQGFVEKRLVDDRTVAERP